MARSSSVHAALDFTSYAIIILLALAAGVPVLALLWLVPSALFLPVLSLTFIAAAALVALLAWTLRIRRTAGPDLWDVAGALTLAAVAAGVFSEPEEAMQLFGLLAAAH